MVLTPAFYEKDAQGERGYDMYSRLLKDRIVLLFNEVTDDLAGSIVAQLLYLESVDPTADIHLYINSPGGSVSAGLAIYDTIKHLRCDVSTVCMGMAASMGAVLLGAGTKGKRLALPNSQVMIHQVLGGASGQASDMAIQAQHMLRIKALVNNLLSADTGRDAELVAVDTDRNYWMMAQDAVAYGLIDRVVERI